MRRSSGFPSHCGVANQIPDFRFQISGPGKLGAFVQIRLIPHRKYPYALRTKDGNQLPNTPPLRGGVRAGGFTRNLTLTGNVHNGGKL
jgi:hypothetical protein